MRDVEQRLLDACARSGRKREDVTIIAVTKYVSAAAASAVVQAGIRHIGENRWPDARDKCELLQGQAVFHYIGSLQTNKVKHVVGRFDYIHSLDRLSLAEAIDKTAQKLGIASALLRASERIRRSKQTWTRAGCGSRFHSQLARFSGHRADRLHDDGAAEARMPSNRDPYFAPCANCGTTLMGNRLRIEPLTELSMGMSGDFEVAVEEGATWVRLGTVLVGNEQIEK